MKEFRKIIPGLTLIVLVVVIATLVQQNIQLSQEVEALREQAAMMKVGDIFRIKEDDSLQDEVDGGFSDEPAREIVGQTIEREPEAPELNPTAVAEASPSPSPSPSERPKETIEPRYYPETHEEMLRYLRSDKEGEEYLPFAVHDSSWWEDGKGNIVERLHPGRKYTAHFFIYMVSERDDVLSKACMRLRAAESIMLGGCYAFPGEPDIFNAFSAYVDFEGYVGTGFELNAVSATKEALKLTVNKNSFVIRQAYGKKAWRLDTDQVESLLEGEKMTIGTTELDGEFATLRENAIEFIFEVTTSETGLASPVIFIRDDGEIAAYDYLNANIWERWVWPAMSEEEKQRTREDFGWKNPW